MSNSPVVVEKPKRRFKSGDPLIDEVYRTADDHLRLNSTLLKPLVYEFNEQTQDHVMTFENKWRFRRNAHSPAVFVEENIPTPQGDQWVNVDVNAITYHSRTPIMWPVTQYNASVYGSIGSEISTACRMAFKELEAKHPKHMNEKYPDRTDQHKKMYQVESVLNKVWQKKMQSFRKANTFSSNRAWWVHFVDRKIFKACVSIMGTSKNAPIYWLSYATLSQTLSKPEVWSNYEKLGLEKSFLDKNNLSTWGSVQAEDLIPQGWKPVWGKVGQLPSSVQQTILRYIERHQSKLSFSMINAFASEEEIYDEMKVNENLLAWRIFEHLKDNKPQKAKWKPRQLCMMWLASQGIEKIIAKELEKLGQFKDKMDVKKFLGDASNQEQLFTWAQKYTPYVYEFTSIWREVDKKGTRSWSMGAQGYFQRVLSKTLEASEAKGELTLNPREVTEEMRDLFNAIQDQRAMKKVVQIKKKTKSGRRM